MDVKKLYFYLVDALITLRSDHLPLKRFLQKSTLNAKVSTWCVELSDFNTSLNFIKSVKKVFTDTLSRLIYLELTEPNPPEKRRH